MAERYDAIIIGGGHNGLDLRRLSRPRRPENAGARAPPRDRRRGGDGRSRAGLQVFRLQLSDEPAAPAESSPTSNSAKYGYKVLPATDMFGPLPGNDYIVFADDIAKTQASFARFSTKDAAIYPEFDRYLMDSVKIMRKLLLETPPDPTCRDWRSFKETAKFLWKYRTRRRQAVPPHRSDDDERRRLSLRMVRELRGQGGARLLLRHRHFCRAEKPGLRLCRHAPSHGRACRRRRLGIYRGGMGVDHPGHRAGRARRRASTSKPTARSPSIDTGGRARDRRDARRRLALSRPASSRAMSRAKLTFLKFLDAIEVARRIRARHRSLSDLLDAHSRSISPARRLPRIHRLRRRGMRVRLSDLHAYRPYDRISRARLRRRQIWRHVARAVHYAGDAELRRQHARAARQTRRPSLRRPCAAHVEAKATGHAERTNWSSNVLRVMDEHAPGFSERHYRHAGADAAGYRSQDRLAAWPYFPWRIAGRSAFLGAPSAALGGLPHADQGLYQCGASAHPGGGVGGVVGHNAAREIFKDNQQMKRLGTAVALSRSPPCCWRRCGDHRTGLSRRCCACAA